jgi:hypothetical protein
MALAVDCEAAWDSDVLVPPSHSRRYRVAGLSRRHRGLRSLPTGTFVDFPTLRSTLEAEAPRADAASLTLCRAFRALGECRTASHPIAVVADATWHALLPLEIHGARFPSIVSPQRCPLPATPTSGLLRPRPDLRSDDSRHRLTFRPRGSSPPRRLAPPSRVATAALRLRACCIPLPIMGSDGFLASRSRLVRPLRRADPSGGDAVTIPPSHAPLEESPSPAAVPRHRGPLPSCRYHPASTGRVRRLRCAPRCSLHPTTSRDSWVARSPKTPQMAVRTGRDRGRALTESVVHPLSDVSCDRRSSDANRRTGDTPTSSCAVRHSASTGRRSREPSSFHRG